MSGGNSARWHARMDTRLSLPTTLNPAVPRACPRHTPHARGPAPSLPSRETPHIRHVHTGPRGPSRCPSSGRGPGVSERQPSGKGSGPQSGTNPDGGRLHLLLLSVHLVKTTLHLQTINKNERGKEDGHLDAGSDKREADQENCAPCWRAVSALLSLEPAQNSSESKAFVSQVENASRFVLRVF